MIFNDRSEEHELLSDITDDFVGDDFKDIEVNGFGERSALSNDNNISFLDCESR